MLEVEGSPSQRDRSEARSPAVGVIGRETESSASRNDQPMPVKSFAIGALRNRFTHRETPPGWRRNDSRMEFTCLAVGFLTIYSTEGRRTRRTPNTTADLPASSGLSSCASCRSVRTDHLLV